MDKEMKIIIAVVVTCLLAFGAALVFSDEHEVKLFINGEEVVVPENKRLVTVPSHWKDSEIYRESHRAESVMNLMEAPPPSCEDLEDMLVIGGAICIP